MQKFEFFIGIDISKLKLDVIVLFEKKTKLKVWIIK
jgi:hypothetical protein